MNAARKSHVAHTCSIHASCILVLPWFFIEGSRVAVRMLLQSVRARERDAEV